MEGQPGLRSPGHLPGGLTPIKKIRKIRKIKKIREAIMDRFDDLLRKHGIPLREANPRTKYAKQRFSGLQKTLNRATRQLSPGVLERLGELFDQAGKPSLHDGEEIMNLQHGKEVKGDYFDDRRPMDLVSGKDAKLWKELLKILGVPGLHQAADRYRLHISRMPGEEIHEVHLHSFIFWIPPGDRTLQNTKKGSTVMEVFWLAEDDFERQIEIDA